MIVCSCNVLSDKAVRGCLSSGPSCPRTAAQVYQCLGCSPKCGRCARTIRAILESASVASAGLAGPDLAGSGLENAILESAIMDGAIGDIHAGCASPCGAACPAAEVSGHLAAAMHQGIGSVASA